MSGFTFSETGFCIKHNLSALKDTMGHTMLIIGYDDSINGGSFLILNSWGSKEMEWADNGKLWVDILIFGHIVMLLCQ